MKEIKDIATYEETDSELAKYTIKSLSSLIRNQVNQLKANDLMIGELINRIDKAIEYIINETTYSDCDEMDKLLDILRCNNKNEIIEDKKIEKLNERYYHDEPALIDDMAHKINEIIDRLNGKDIKEIPQFQGTLEALDKLNII